MWRMGARAILLAAVIALGVVATPAPASAGGIRVVPVATGLDSPVGFTISPQGRLVYLERNTGWLRFRNLQTDVDTRIYRITNVNSLGERGALGVALHPSWPVRPFVYAFATRNTSVGLRNQVLRTGSRTATPRRYGRSCRRARDRPRTTTAAGSPSVPTGSCTS